MIKIKKFMAVFAITLLLVTSFMPANSTASSDSLDRNMVTKIGEDVKINYIDKSSWEYYQERDGQVYKIEESVDEGGVVTSLINEIDENGDLSLSKTLVTTPKENDVEIKTIESGNTKTENIKIESTVEVELTPNNNGVNAIGTSSDLTPWIYSYTSYDDASLARSLTYGAIATIIASIFNLGLGASIVVGAAATLAAEYTPNIYTRHQRSVKNVTGTTILAGIMDDRWVYENSNYTGIIAYDNEVDCAPGYSCN